MSTYILVHGACHGGWCWHHIVPLLQKEGHTVLTPDLPGHSVDHSISLSDGTLRLYIDRIKDVINGQSEPVILVAHSFGGVVASQVAEECSENIQKLIYIAAYLLPENVSTTQILQQDTQSLAPKVMEIDEANNLARIPLSKARELFYHDCFESDVALALTLLTPEALKPVLEPVHIGDHFASIPRFYVETLHDRVISLDIQRFMYTNLACERVFSLPTGHSPFFTAPDSLAEILLTLV